MTVDPISASFSVFILSTRRAEKDLVGHVPVNGDLGALDVEDDVAPGLADGLHFRARCEPELAQIPLDLLLAGDADYGAPLPDLGHRYRDTGGLVTAGPLAVHAMRSAGADARCGWIHGVSEVLNVYKD